MKLAATRDAFRTAFRKQIDAKGLRVPHLSPQPTELRMTLDGAVRRAKYALAKAPRATFGVGIEASLISVPYATTGHLDQYYTVILDREGTLTIGASPSFEYPAEIVREVQAGADVQRAMEKVFGLRRIGEREGAVGYLSNHMQTRREIIRESVLMALIPHIGFKFYQL